MNEIYNSLCQVSMIVLATEGIKSIATLWGHAIKGKTALGVFVLLVVLQATTNGAPDRWTYIAMTAVNLLGSVGGYNFVSRLLKALAARK